MFDKIVVGSHKITKIPGPIHHFLWCQRGVFFGGEVDEVCVCEIIGKESKHVSISG
jgi:hypothetical protein